MPVTHPNVYIYGEFLCFQCHFESICLQVRFLRVLVTYKPKEKITKKIRNKKIKTMKWKARIKLEIFLIDHNLYQPNTTIQRFQGVVTFTCSSVIFRKGEPPPMAAYPSLLLGALSTEMSCANGRWRNWNNLGSRMISCSQDTNF